MSSNQNQLAIEVASLNMDVDCLGLCLTLSTYLANALISLSLNFLTYTMRIIIPVLPATLEL